ncbi:hypothetical protein GQF61_14390 [Sphingobacterium sp. DK4209]|uniref:HEAT repeat domain-containing protein n=1 Tax=Sphingobacterium zhuxiongii TaxID=2662364 RepID=A0A5Q0QGB8_9SPHI|nr:MULTISPECIES: HEAT repeat domain-containing protein [unclassified Sphingobacterium]MVZ67047.1 hypothetical protein [Sphingobacterium sp. DK4209]QGA26662.1 hypothetical protein GFH32_10130 [Sphingobacterium sp. dk4302]
MDLTYYIQYYALYLESKFFGYPLIIRLTVLLVSILVLVYVFSLIRFLAINLYLKTKERRKSKIESKMGDRINAIIFEQANLTEEHVAFQLADSISLVKNKQDKMIFTDIIIALIQNGAGTKTTVNQTNVRALLNAYEIPSFWEKELLSSSSNRRRNALRKLDDLGNGCAGAIVMRSAYHKDKGLRKHARAAALGFDNNDPFKFLEDSFDSDFNALDEVLIHHFLTGRAKSGPLPLLTRWVRTSENEAFKAFMIKEIGFFKQLEASVILTSMLEVETSNVLKVAIIETLGKLDHMEVEPKLFNLFGMNNSEVQRAIIKTVTLFQSEAGLEFLSSNYNRTHDHELKIEIAYAIQQFGAAGNAALKELSATSNEFGKKIFDQVTYQSGV